MIAAVIHVVAETRSFERAAQTLTHVLGHGPSAKTIERLAHQVGGEWHQTVPPTIRPVARLGRSAKGARPRCSGPGSEGR